MEPGSHDQSIYNAATICSDLFELYLESPGAAEPRHDLAEELRGRFNLWAAYVGAFAAPKASLDARLVAHSDIRDMVLELLVMVQKNIRQGTTILLKSSPIFVTINCCLYSQALLTLI
jgi:hypothetical protein